jgi:hypothetical protein
LISKMVIPELYSESSKDEVDDESFGCKLKSFQSLIFQIDRSEGCDKSFSMNIFKKSVVPKEEIK